MTDLKTDPLEAEFERFMDATQTVIQLKPGQLTAEQVAEIQFAFEYERRDQEDKVDVFHRGYKHGIERTAGTDKAALIEKIDDLQSELRTVKALNRYFAAEDGKHFQARVEPWLLACFGEEIADDTLERRDRAVEEFFEFLQWSDYPRERLAALEAYVWSRPVGEGHQELGGMMVTIAAMARAYRLDMHECGEVELARILAPEIIEKIRAKQAAKPTGSALPIAGGAGQTYRHADGGLYRIVELGEMKHPDTGAWLPTVNYRAVEGGPLYTTTDERWRERFKLEVVS